MKLPYTAFLTLFLNSVVSAKTTGGDDNMIRNLLAKVDALHDAKIAQDAKIDELNEKNAKLEALLLGAPRVPQGKKNLRRRGLREDDATVDFATMTEEKTEDIIAQHGLAHVLKSIIFEMNPVINCLSYDKVSQTCALGSDFTNNVDIIAEDDIDITAGASNEGGDINLDAQADYYGYGGEVNIHADEGVDIDTDDFTIHAEGVSIDTDDFNLSAGSVDIDADTIDLRTDDGDITLNAGCCGDVAVLTNGVNAGGDFKVDGVVVNVP